MNLYLSSGVLVCSPCMVSVYLSLGRLSELNLLYCFFVVHGICRIGILLYI